jgi:ribosome biogenesis GTPase
MPGRVIQITGLTVLVQVGNGVIYRCTVRRLLKTLATDERSAVTTGDKVWIIPEQIPLAQELVPKLDPVPDSAVLPVGVVQTVEPRKGILTRKSKHKDHVIVANVDQVMFVISLSQPELKVHLVDRYIAGALEGNLEPILCFNKVDLISEDQYQYLVGLYSQLGYKVLFTSTRTGVGIDDVRHVLSNKQSVVCGQSGVGKSSLLNAVQPNLGLRVNVVSEVNQKGKHTTTSAKLIPLECKGWVVDTPGIRSFELSNQMPSEVENFFREFRPMLPYCEFADCTHTHETGCAIKRQVFRRVISPDRYLSYLGMIKKEDPHESRHER